MRKIGLWLPGRKDLSLPITPARPAHIDDRLRTRLLEWLRDRNFDVQENLDFRQAVIRNGDVWLQGQNLSQLDDFFWMGMIDRSPDSYHLEVLRVLSRTTNVHNSWDFYSVGTDKFLAFSQLHQHGIPVSECLLVNPDNLDFLEAEFAHKRFLLKPRRSHFGSGIIRLENFEQLRDTVAYARQKDYYLERYYPNDLARWTGVTVMNDQVVYGFRKDSSLVAGWKVYDDKHVGGKTVPVVPTKEQIEIARKIGQILGGNYFGLDFIHTEGGPIVVDINMSPGMYFDFFQNLGLDFGDCFFGKVLEK